MPTGQNRCGFLMKIDDKYHIDYCKDYENCEICRNNDRCQCMYCSNPDSATCFEIKQFQLIYDIEQLYPIRNTDIIVRLLNWEDDDDDDDEIVQEYYENYY